MNCEDGLPEYSWLLTVWPLPLWEERREGARPCLRSRPLSNGSRQTPDKTIILVIGGVLLTIINSNGWRQYENVNHKWITSMTSLCSEGFNLKRNSSSQRGFNVLFLVFVRTESTTWCLQVLRSRRSSTWKRYLIAPDCDQINSYIGVAGPKDVFLGQVVRRDHLIWKLSSKFGQKFGAP